MKKISITQAIFDPENWKPNIAQMSKQTKIAQSTINGYVKRRLKKKLISIHVIENTESKAKELTESN